VQRRQLVEELKRKARHVLDVDRPCLLLPQQGEDLLADVGFVGHSAGGGAATVNSISR
jgi:hypothetical protein